MRNTRKQTFADDFQGEIDRVNEQADGGRRRTFAGDFSAYIRRADSGR